MSLSIEKLKELVEFYEMPDEEVGPNYLSDASRETSQALRELIAIKEDNNWQPIETVPKDGSEFLVCYGRQGNAKKLISWNTIHGYWQSKGNWEPGLMQNATLWMPISEPPKETK